MKIAGLVGAFSLLFLISSCAQVSDEDVRDLRSANTAEQRKALHKIARGEGFLSMWTGSDSSKERAVEVIQTLVSDENASYDIEFRLLALHALEKLAEKAHVPDSVFIQHLDSDDRRIRRQAVQTMAKVGGEKAAAALTRLIRQEANNYEAIWALGEIGGTEVVPVLNGMLNSDDGFVRYNAHKALKKISRSANDSKRDIHSYPLRLIGVAKGALQTYVESMQGLFKQIGGLKEAWVGW